MRRTRLRLVAVIGSVCAWTASAMAGDFNPFAQQTTPEAAVAPLSPPEVPLSPPPEVHPREGEPGLSEGGFESHEADHFEHDADHSYSHPAHHEEHEEPLGNIRITPLYREIESGIWDRVFKNMYSVNVGTTFWQPEHPHGYFNTQVGLVTEFQYSHLDGRSGTTINSVVSIPFAIRETVRVRDADIYAGNIGLSFAVNTYLPDSCTKLELGISPLLTIGSLNADLQRSAPFGPPLSAILDARHHAAPGGSGLPQGDIILGRRASDNGTIVGGDFRVWTGIKTQSGFRTGLTGFYGVAETDAIFDSSKTFNTYGGGFYVEIPTRCIPHEFPAPTGAFQWFEELFHLH